ncbi:MAG: hypothetical protein QOJ63_1976 [Solirubrobacteraceae bacterium]|nr:hypothetical protein [Solirubrobacteraceae bacterium]
MQIIVNHVTRMRSPRICVAGVDTETFAHIRPTTRSTDLITRTLLRENGGPFGVGALVDLGPVRAQPNPPETEDHGFVTANARRLKDITSDEYVAVLQEVSVATLEEAFGHDLECVNYRKYAIEAGRGTQSLAVIRLRGRPRLRADNWGKLLLELNDPNTPCSLSMTDVRFYETDQTTIKHGVVADVNTRLSAGVDAFLMLGLARAFVAKGYDRSLHFLQGNGLCLVDRAAGDLP